ncbi:MAG: hypothetical protein KGI40_00060 [Xanthomonadaceae bacterium]|nr:hypothetical protein [Xanthomonadaceae bacterium]MDE1957465.1 hypothetical protein [Xanthomonadaceae bacterium]MDE2177396.1 hypothetical protein [Xanthomonadaceae bacterium]
MHTRNPFAVSALAAMLLAAGAVPTPAAAARKAVPGAPSAAISGDRGEARDDAGRLVYIEQDFVWDGGTRRLTLYRCPDGLPFARREDDARGGDPAAPDFALDDAQTGYREGVRRNADGMRRVYVRTNRASHEKSRPLPAARHLVIDAGFDAFVRAHFDALLSGVTVPVEFLVPSRLRAIGFRITRIEDTAAAARGEVAFRLELGRWFGFLLPHIDVRYDLRTRALRRYAGLSNLRDARGDNIRVTIDFPPAQSRSDIPRAELAAARDADLDGRCPLR